MNLTAVCSKLQRDPDALTWSEKLEVAGTLGESLARREKLSAPGAIILAVLATDAKWEVRKAVADLLHLVPDGQHFNGLAAQLGADDNHYVRNTVQKAVERRSRSRVGGQRFGRGLKKAESEIEAVARKHGADVAQVVREQAVRLYEGLVGGSVHELRAVAVAMRGYVDILVTEMAKGNGEKAAARYGPRLRSSLDSMEQLLADMRLYSLLPPKKRHTELVASVVHEALAMVHAEFSANGREIEEIDVAVSVPADLALPVSRAQVVLALRNVIKNAYESFLEDDGTTLGHGKVQIEALQQGEWVVVRVRDDGVGIGEQLLDEVQQFIPGKTAKRGGTGFGLPTAQRFIGFHGGTLGISSAHGKGTVVEIRLPIETKPPQ